jgi:two-component system sensor histidine kinase YesM
MRTWEQQQRRLEILQKQADLQAYQSQISPHFLYNMLDAIRGQALEDGSTAASDMIESLSAMMRYVISNKDNMVTLGTEIKSVDNYIKIQQYRFGSRFVYNKYLDELDSGHIEMKIPKMTIQPIIENAISHGVEPMISGGEISLTVFNTQSRVIIQVADNGTGMDCERLAEVRRKLLKGEVAAGTESGRGTGIALQNVNARIKLAFGDRFGISVSSTVGMGTSVEISLPAGV